MLTEAQNWSTAKKLITLSVVCFGSIRGSAASSRQLSRIFPQAALYHETAVELSYEALKAFDQWWGRVRSVEGRTSCL